MSKMITIRLSEAQHAELSADVEASGAKFFDFCRDRLLGIVSRGQPVSAAKIIPQFTTAPDDRLERLERSVEQLAAALQHRAAPQVGDFDDAGQFVEMVEPASAMDDIDPDALASEALAQMAPLVDAERNAVVQAEAEVGVRHLGTRPPPRFSAAAQAKHLAGLG